MAVTMMIAVIFRDEDQFIGFSGSSGPSKSTVLASFSVIPTSFSWSDDLSMSNAVVSRSGRSGDTSLIDLVGWAVILGVSSHWLLEMADTGHQNLRKN
jgi:hypothetical protein